MSVTNHLYLLDNLNVSIRDRYYLILGLVNVENLTVS